MKSTISIRKAVRFTTLTSAGLLVCTACDPNNAARGDILPGVVIEQSRMAPLQDQLVNVVTSAPPLVMKGGGLTAVRGGVRLKLLNTGTHEVLLPIPQLTDAQVPLCYTITTTPREAGKQYRLRPRDGSNVVVSVQLNGSRDQELQIDWSAVILIVHQPVSPDRSPPEPYLRETACVQSGAPQVKRLADKLWPANGKIDGYAANIQEFIRGMKQEKQPRSIDASGILESGCNWICTANANLAAALLRSKNIPARTIAVIPLTAQRLEMHRIVQYFQDGEWRKFDPSSLHKDIPLKPWHNIIVSRTTMTDEQIAMKPRMGTALGCPYGQELEFLDGAITLWGNDFFWTIGKPLLEFEASDEAVDLASTEWNRFLQTGKLSQSLVKAASATNPAAFLEALRAK